MKIYCDFCGAQIETSENKTCPHCGGYYSTDEELLKEKERVRQLNELDKQQKELNMEQQQLDLERMKLENTMMKGAAPFQNRTFAKGCLTAVITGLAFFGIFFVLMLICVFLDASPSADDGKYTGTAARTDKSYTFSMEPIDMPDIPEIEIPDITIER